MKKHNAFAEHLETHKRKTKGLTGNKHSLRPVSNASLDNIDEILRVKHINDSSHRTFHAAKQTAYYGEIASVEIHAGKANTENAFYGDISAELIKSEGNLTAYGVTSPNHQEIKVEGDFRGGNLHSYGDQKIARTANHVHIVGKNTADGYQAIGTEADHVTLQGVFEADNQYLGSLADTIRVQGRFESGFNQNIGSYASAIIAQGRFKSRFEQNIGDSAFTASLNLQGDFSARNQTIGHVSDSVVMQGTFNAERDQEIARHAKQVNLSMQGEYEAGRDQYIADFSEGPDASLQGRFVAGRDQHIADAYPHNPGQILRWTGLTTQAENNVSDRDNFFGYADQRTSE